MSGAWSHSEVKVLVDAVDEMKRQSASLDCFWSIRTLLPHRTATAIEKRYYLYVRESTDSDNSDDNDADADAADLEYFKTCRERTPLTVDLIYAAATFRRPQTLQVRM
jgi:hypothetical protein